MAEEMDTMEEIMVVEIMVVEEIVEEVVVVTTEEVEVVNEVKRF